MIKRTLSDQVLCVDLQPTEYVIVRSETFGDCHGYVQEIPHYVDPRAPSVTVRIEVEDDHPAMLDALADNPGRESDWVEFVDHVPVASLERPDGRPIRAYVRGLTGRERAARARSRGFSRLSLPDLDASLATQVKRGDAR